LKPLKRGSGKGPLQGRDCGTTSIIEEKELPASNSKPRVKTAQEPGESVYDIAGAFLLGRGEKGVVAVRFGSN